jgi:hypothetical protein
MIQPALRVLDENRSSSIRPARRAHHVEERSGRDRYRTPVR